MNIEQERKAFEEKFKNFDLSKYNNVYNQISVAFMWQAWQERASQSPWISVDVALPEFGRFFVRGADNYYGEAEYIGNGLFYGFIDECEQEIEATHWMPIPAIPK